MRQLIAAALIAAFPASAGAADRALSITSFERVRVEGPYDVRVTIGRPPAARANGDARALDALDLRVEGTTLIVRGRATSDAPRSAPGRPVVVTVATPRLTAANLNGGGALAIAGPLTGQRVDLSVNGAGTLTATGVAADQLNATLIGSGTLTLAGRAQRALIVASGAGVTAAEKLTVGDLTVRQEGSGTLATAARFTATGSSSGLGAITVTGAPACTIRALGGGTVRCGR